MKPAVLIVEDSFLISHHLQVLVEEAGYNVCGVCESGEVAIELASLRKPEIIFMDISLFGNMNGVTAANIIHDIIKTEIVFLSALASISKLENSNQFRFFVKPFDDTEILNYLKCYLAKAN